MTRFTDLLIFFVCFVTLFPSGPLRPHLLLDVACFFVLFCFLLFLFCFFYSTQFWPCLGYTTLFRVRVFCFSRSHFMVFFSPFFLLWLQLTLVHFLFSCSAFKTTQTWLFNTRLTTEYRSFLHHNKSKIIKLLLLSPKCFYLGLPQPHFSFFLEICFACILFFFFYFLIVFIENNLFRLHPLLGMSFFSSTPNLGSNCFVRTPVACLLT